MLPRLLLPGLHLACVRVAVRGGAGDQHDGGVQLLRQRQPPHLPHPAARGHARQVSPDMQAVLDDVFFGKRDGFG